MEDLGGALIIDEGYEFSAPRFYDFINGETEEEKTNAELWFETAISHAPSPVMARIKIGRDVRISIEFNDADQMTKEVVPLESANTAANVTEELKSKIEQSLTRDSHSTKINEENKSIEHLNLASEAYAEEKSCKVAEGIPTENGSTSISASPEERAKSDETTTTARISDVVCTPKLPVLSAKRDPTLTQLKSQQMARKIASLVKNPSGLKTKGQCQQSQAKSTKSASTKRDLNQKSSVGAPSLAHQNQPVKRQKLDGGHSRKPPNLAHKSRLGSTNNITAGASNAKTRMEDRKIYVREQVAPFISTEEIVKKFQSSIKDLSLPQNSVKKFQSSIKDLSLPQNSVSHGALKLTRPKEPKFETAQRVRPVRVKSVAELEEEAMAKMPKFKPTRLNKKIFEAPTLPPLPKSIPRPPEFQEFHLETMVRASNKSETSSVVSNESSSQQNNHQWKPRLTEPKTPLLQTSLRAKPSNVKSSLEIEEEDLKKIPKFKARPLNKKILESKGDFGLFSNNKKPVTIPQEFHFAIDERIPPPSAMVVDLFDKFSISSESNRDHIPSITKPNPFNLHTEGRGAEKERRFLTELMQKELEEAKARVPKACPYPYTTDYPVVPPKPEPKQCTRPEPFQLDSLVRHEKEMQRGMEERLRKEREEAQMRIFKAQSVLKEDLIPVPEKQRKPLTQVQEFNLCNERRAVERAEFNKKVKEKEVVYKRYREEQDAAKMMEEDRALKQLRRTLVPHARPVPKFANPFVPQRSCKEITKAKSPKLRVAQRKERQSTAVAGSSPACQMR